MARSDRRIIGGLLTLAAVAVAAWAAAWFLQNFARVTETERVGYSAEARRNPLLALERLLAALEQPVTRYRGADIWSDLPPASDTLVVYRFHCPENERRREAIRQWVNQGGRLVLGLEPGSPLRRGLLPGLGAHVVDAPENAPERLPLEHPRAGGAYVEPASVRRLTSEMAPDAIWAGDEHGPVIARYDYGLGELVLLADARMLANRGIASADNGFAAVLIAEAPTPNGTVWLAPDIAMAPLPTLIWRHSTAAVLTAATTVLLWLWSRGRALGPPAPPAHAPRRDLGEHLQADAALRWRLGHGRDLLLRTRERLLAEWQRAHPRLGTLEPERRSAWIAARSALTRTEVEQALHGEAGNATEFLRITRAQQLLHSQLKGTKP